MASPPRQALTRRSYTTFNEECHEDNDQHMVLNGGPATPSTLFPPGVAFAALARCLRDYSLCRSTMLWGFRMGSLGGIYCANPHYCRPTV